MDLTLASEARIAGSIPAEGVVFRVTVVVSSLARGVPHMRLQVRILSGTFFAYLTSCCRTGVKHRLLREVVAVDDPRAGEEHVRDRPRVAREVGAAAVEAAIVEE